MAPNTSSFVQGFTLNPLPYPVIFILVIIFVFLGLKLNSDCNDVVEATVQDTNWALFLTPIFILILLRFLPYNHRVPLFSLWHPSNPNRQIRSDDGGSSPWGIAAIIVLLLVLLYFHPAIIHTWSV